MEQKMMKVDELSGNDSAPAKLSNQVEDVQLSVKCNFDRKFEDVDSADLETEFSRLPHVLDQNHQDFHRNMNADETFIQENCLSAKEPNQNYFCDGKGMFESVGAVRFETAFMQNSLSRLYCEDDDFRIDSHPTYGSQRNLKHSGANVSQAITTTSLTAINMPVQGEGHIINEVSSPDEVISETESQETNEDPVIQLVNSGVSGHQKENCKGEIGCGHLAEREAPSNTKKCERNAGAEHGFKASLDATADQLEHKLSSDIKIECPDQKQLTTKTANETVCDAAAKDYKSVNPNLGKGEIVKTLMVVCDQRYSNPGEMIQNGHEINEMMEAWVPPLCIKAAGPLTECKSSTESKSTIDREIAGESLIATACESAVESKSTLESNSAMESKHFCESEGEASSNLDLSQIHRCDTRVISDTCNDLIKHQNAYENERILEFFNQAGEIFKNIGKDEIETESKHDAGNDFQVEVKAENMTEDRTEIIEDFENNLNVTTENAVNGSNNTEFYYKVKDAFEAEQINEIEDDIQDKWKAKIFAMPFPILRENSEVPKYQQDINLKIKDDAVYGSITDDKTDEEKENTESAVMDEISLVADEDQSVIEVEHNPKSELDDKYDDDGVEENSEICGTADANRIENYSSEYVNMNENEVNDRNDRGSKVKTEIDDYDHDENKMKEELFKKMKTEHESHLETEACMELEVETRSKIVIEVQDEVEDKLEIAQLPVSGHQTEIDETQLQHDAENKMGEKLLTEDESKTGNFVENDNEDSSQKIMSGNLCDIAEDMIDKKCGTFGENSVSKTDKGKQTDEDEAIFQFENGVSIENEHVVENILGVNSVLDLEPENKCIHQKEDGFRQHEIAEVAKGELLNEVVQNAISASNVGDTAECVAVHGLTDVSLSEGLLKNHPTSNINVAETEFNFTPFGPSQQGIHNERRGFTISVDSCCSEIGASITTSTEHQMTVSHASFEGCEMHLECSYECMPPIFTGKTKIPDAYLENNLTQHDVKDVDGDQQSNSTEVQDCYQNPRSVQKETSNLDFLLPSTFEKSYSDTSNSFSVQAEIINCDDTTANVDFVESTSVSDQFMTSNDENSGLIKAFTHCDDEITAFSYLDYGLGSDAVNLTTKCYCSVPDLEANEGDSNSCNALGDIPNQTDSLALPKLRDKSQKYSNTSSANECISSHFTANEEETSCAVQNTRSSETFVLSPTDNSFLLYSSTVLSRYVTGVNPDEAFWPDVTLLKTESCFSKVSQNPNIRGDEPLNYEEPLPVKNQGRVQQQPASVKHLQQELHKVENLDVFAVPQFLTDSCAVDEGSGIQEVNPFGKVSDVRVADTSITQSDFAKQFMIKDQPKERPQEVPSCNFTEHGTQMSTEKTSTICINASMGPSPAKEISPCSKCVFEIPSDEQQVPSVEGMKHENQMRDVSCLPNHLEETLYEEPPVKRYCFDVGVGGNFDHDIDDKWCKDKHDTNLGGLTNLTGGGKERVPLYAWKNFAEPNFEDRSGITEQSYPISRDTAAMPLVIPLLNKCQKPMRLGLSRRYRAPTRLHPNYKTPTD